MAGNPVSGKISTQCIISQKLLSGRIFQIPKKVAGVNIKAWLRNTLENT